MNLVSSEYTAALDWTNYIVGKSRILKILAKINYLGYVVLYKRLDNVKNLDVLIGATKSIAMLLVPFSTSYNKVVVTKEFASLYDKNPDYYTEGDVEIDVMKKVLEKSLALYGREKIRFFYKYKFTRI